MTTIMARTMLKTHSGQDSLYEIWFQMDENKNFKFKYERGEIQVRPYLLLYLLEEVLQSFAPEVLEPDAGPVATGYINEKHKKNQMSLQTSDGVFHRIKPPVEGKWIETQTILEMVRYIHSETDGSKSRSRLSSWYNPGWVWRPM